MALFLAVSMDILDLIKNLKEKKQTNKQMKEGIFFYFILKQRL